MILTTYRLTNGTVLGSRQEPDAVIDELKQACLDVTEWIYNSAVYRVKGLRVSPIGAENPSLQVVLEWLHDTYVDE
jgi:hypothetical protein